MFHVHSANPADAPRFYTVEPGKQLSGSWKSNPSYGLSVYGPNGFVRFFKGRVGSGASILDVVCGYDTRGQGAIEWGITNLNAAVAVVNVLDAYSGDTITSNLQPLETVEGKLSLGQFQLVRPEGELLGSGSRQAGYSQGLIQTLGVLLFAKPLRDVRGGEL